MRTETKNEVMYERCFIVYLEDDDRKIERKAEVLQDNNGVWIRINESRPFFIPYHRVLKIKPRGEGDVV